jgi:hypothetical protein
MSSQKENIASSGWDAAISDAQKRIKKLETAISVCEEKKANGEPWPGSLPDFSCNNVTDSATQSLGHYPA